MQDRISARQSRGLSVCAVHAVLAMVAFVPGCAAPDARDAEATSPEGLEGHGHESFHRHHVGIFLGGGVETHKGHDDEAGYALGLDYEYRVHEELGFGAILEGLGSDTIRDYALVLQLNYHPGAGPWRIIAGPGVELLEGEDKLMFRMGGGYGFQLWDGWSLSPEAYVDLIETGERTYVAGLAIGYGF
jgi:hypothetical protein